MAPKPFTGRRRDAALEHTFGETLLVIAVMSLLPLTAFLAVAFPTVALASVGGIAAVLGGLTAGPRLSDAVRSLVGGRSACVPATDVCVEV